MSVKDDEMIQVKEKTTTKYDLLHLDAFGTPVQLKFDGKTTYKTRIGGCCTTVLILIIFWIFMQRIQQLFMPDQPFQVTVYAGNIADEELVES